MLPSYCTGPVMRAMGTAVRDFPSLGLNRHSAPGNAGILRNFEILEGTTTSIFDLFWVCKMRSNCKSTSRIKHRDYDRFACLIRALLYYRPNHVMRVCHVRSARHLAFTDFALLRVPIHDYH